MSMWRSAAGRSYGEEQLAVNEALEVLARSRFTDTVTAIDHAVDRFRTYTKPIGPQSVIDELLDLRNRLVKARPKGGAS